MGWMSGFNAGGNGPEFIAQALELWAKEDNVTLDFIEPGKPAQNGYIERFNRTYREDILDMYLFRSIDEARQLSEAWHVRYNTERPHDSLEGMTPNEYALSVQQSLAVLVRSSLILSTYDWYYVWDVYNTISDLRTTEIVPEPNIRGAHLWPPFTEN
jgi:hypothetical protein